MNKDHQFVSQYKPKQQYEFGEINAQIRVGIKMVNFDVAPSEDSEINEKIQISVEFRQPHLISKKMSTKTILITKIISYRIISESKRIKFDSIIALCIN